MFKCRRILYEIVLVAVIVLSLYCLIWLIPLYLFGSFYVLLKLLHLEKIIFPDLFFILIFSSIIWAFMFKMKSKQWKFRLIQDAGIIFFGLPFSHVVLSVFHVGIDDGMPYPYPLIFMGLITFFLVQLSHWRNLSRVVS